MLAIPKKSEIESLYSFTYVRMRIHTIVQFLERESSGGKNALFSIYSTNIEHQLDVWSYLEDKYK